MREIRWATPQDWGEIHTLWGCIFGDGPDAQREVIHAFGGVERVLLLLEGGILRSMTTLSPLALQTPAGGERAAYLYALATHPDARGRGLGGALVRGGEELLAAEGVTSVILVPAEPSLFDYYRPLGYIPAFFQKRLELDAPLPSPPPEARPIPVEPDEYNTLRRQLLSGRCYVDYPTPMIALQGQASRLTGGGLVKLSLPGGTACAALEGRERTMWARELLCAPEDIPTALACLMAAYPAPHYQCNVPVGDNMPGERAPLGVIHRLDGGDIPANGWLGFPFD